MRSALREFVLVAICQIAEEGKYVYLTDLTDWIDSKGR